MEDFHLADIKPIGLKIKELRKLRKMTQKDLAEASGFSRSYISKLEMKGKSNITYEALEVILECLQAKLIISI